VEASGCVGFPVVGEAVDVVEFDRAWVSMRWVNIPPRPTAENWWGSPTITTLHFFWSARRISSASLGVETVPGLVHDHG
jgi:hypothetical protein